MRYPTRTALFDVPHWPLGLKQAVFLLRALGQDVDPTDDGIQLVLVRLPSRFAFLSRRFSLALFALSPLLFRFKRIGSGWRSRVLTGPGTILILQFGDSLPQLLILFLQPLATLRLFFQKIEQAINDLAIPRLDGGLQFLPKFTQLLHPLTYTPPHRPRKHQLRNGRVLGGSL